MVPSLFSDNNYICGGDIVDNEFVFPSNALAYNNSIDCVWTIQRSDIFTLKFKRFDVENCTSCQCDYLQLGDGRICGNDLPNDYVSAGGDALKLQFHSDGSISGSGFEFEVISEKGN